MSAAATAASVAANCASTAWPDVAMVGGFFAGLCAWTYILMTIGRKK